MNLPWTDDRVERVIELNAIGLSAAQIANVIGGSTRCAVIGKLHRLGLIKSKPHPSTYKRSGQKSQRVRRAKRAAREKISFYPPPDLDKLRPPPSAPAALGLNIVEVKSDQCKFIAGDDGLCCGHPALKDEAYCPTHRDYTRRPA